MRIREQNGIITLTLKIELKLGTFEEYEITVNNLQESEEILKHLGMRRPVVIDKQRKTTNVANFNLCFDYVKDLGDFLEIEYLSEQEDLDSNLKIMEFAKKFDLTENDIVKNTYNTLLCRKFNLS